MRVRVEPEADRPIYTQIVDEVRRAMIMGALKPGDPLPSVRSLADEIEVNPNTVRQAYSALQHEGLVETRRGRGTFATEKIRSERTAERSIALREVAERAIKEAYRHGFGANELLAAIERAIKGEDPPSADL